MQINQFRITRATHQILLTLLVCGASSAVMAAGNPSDAVARYQAERATCYNGQSNEARATCLKEAGAALQAARSGGLTNNSSTYAQNAMARCQPLPPDEQDACRRRIEGEGTSSGSAQQGGILRELTVPDRK